MANVNIKKNKQNNNKSNRSLLIASVAIVLIFVMCLSLVIVTETGVNDRSLKVMTSEHYTVNGAMLKYFFHTQYNTFYSRYGSIASYIGLDTSKPLNQQKCSWSDRENGTWYDYFMDAATAELKRCLLYCEGAVKAGIKLDDEDSKTIDETLTTLKEAAKENKYSYDAYIAALFGTGVKEKDVRSSLELVQLASKYSEKLIKDFKDATTEDDVNEYYNGHITDFMYADYISFEWTAKLTEVKEADYEDKNKYNEDKAAAEKEYNDLKTKYKGYAEELEKLANDKEAFEKKLREIIYTETDKEERKSNFQKKLDEYKSAHKDASEEEAKAKVEEEIKETVDKKVDEVMENALHKKSAYTISTDLGKWIFGTKMQNTHKHDENKTDDSNKDDDKKDDETPTDPAKAGSVKTITTDEKTEKESNTFKVTVAYLVSEAARSEAETRKVGHILIKTTASSSASDEEKKKASEKIKKKIDEIYDEYKKGPQTREAFEELAKKYTEDSNVFYEGVVEGDMVDGFNDWLFCLNDYKDQTRTVGETALVETKYGWHLVYFDGIGKAEWYEDAFNGSVSHKVDDWEKQAEKDFAVNINEKKIAKVSV